jgi:hypothetical protein
VRRITAWNYRATRDSFCAQLNCKTKYNITFFKYKIRFYFIVIEHTYHVEEHLCQKILKGSQISPLPALEIRNYTLEQNVLE